MANDGDSCATKHVRRSYVQDLLESGVRVLCYCKGMIHAKTVIIDGEVATIGTSNMDYRSFNINFEVNVLLYDDGFAKEMITIYEDALKDCEELNLEDWKKRSLVQKLKESFNHLWHRFSKFQLK